MTVLRAMSEDDLDDCESLWHHAFNEMRARFHLPTVERTSERADRDRRRMRHLLSTDPDGSWVVVDADAVVGVAQALRRERLWVLSLLGVGPSSQGRGVGGQLLERVLDYGSQEDPGLILSSRDPKALRRYVLSGFRLHPAMAAWGTVDRRKLEPAPGVRDGSEDDLDLATAVDQKLRGASHGPDFLHLLADGARLLILPDQGYAMIAGGRPILIGALDEDAARRLLMAALAEAPEGGKVEVGWLTSAQQWAIGAVLGVGLELHPVGAVMVRQDPGPLAPYVPIGTFG